MEKENNNNNKKRITVTVYLDSQKHKDEMDEYRKDKGYSSLSSMLKAAFRILKLVDTSDSSKPSLSEQLERIEHRLEEIQLEQRIIEQQEQTINQEVEDLAIPDFSIIAAEILDLLGESEGMKDFALMQHLRTKYSEGIVWGCLLQLKKQDKIYLENGIWNIK